MYWIQKTKTMEEEPEDEFQNIFHSLNLIIKIVSKPKMMSKWFLK